MEPGCGVEMCGWTTASEFCLISTLGVQPGVYGEHSCGSDYLYCFAPFHMAKIEIKMKH